jgi:ParB family chromosome partitioning protein
MNENAIDWVPIESIYILNPRFRDQHKFQELVHNVKKVGLKRPITISLRATNEENGKKYNLVCGQGRIEACKELGHNQVPARIISVSTKEALLRSLIENIARRVPHVKEEMANIYHLKNKGYSVNDIAKKIGLTSGQVSRYCSFFKNGETRLLNAVLRGNITIEAATRIAQSDSADVRKVLQDAYEKKLIGRHELKIAQEIAEDRLIKGKKYRSTKPRRKTTMSTNELVHAIQKGAKKKEAIVKKAHSCENQLLFIENSLKNLFSEPEFTSLVTSEKLNEIPSSLAKRIQH